MSKRAASNWLLDAFQGAKPSSGSKGLISLPSRDASKQSGIYINSHDVVAISISAAGKNSRYDSDAPTELTVALRNGSALAVSLDNERAIEFAKTIYDHSPENFVNFQHLSRPGYSAGRDQIYLFAKNEKIIGEIRTSDLSQAWGIDLYFAGGAKIEYHLNCLQHIDHETRKYPAVQNFAEILGEASEELAISSRGYMHFTNKPDGLKGDPPKPTVSSLNHS